MSHADDAGRQSRRSSVAKVPSDGLSDGSTHDSDLHRSRASKTSQEFTCLEAFANPKRENWCDVRDDDDSDDQDLWLSASPFKEPQPTEAPATPSRRRPAQGRRRSKRDSPREEIHSQGRPEAVVQQPQIPGSVVTIADIGLPCGAPQMAPAAKAMPTPPMWPGIMSTSPIEQPRPAVFLPCGAIGASGGPPARSPMNGGSALPVGSPTGDASTRAIYSGSPTFMGAPMTPMTPIDPSLRAAPQWPDASPVYQPCAWPWPPAGVQPVPGCAPMAPPAGVAPMMAPPTWPQEPQWNPGGMPAWQGCQGVQQGPPGTYIVMGDGMAGYVANMEA